MPLHALLLRHLLVPRTNNSKYVQLKDVTGARPHPAVSLYNLLVNFVYLHFLNTGSKVFNRHRLQFFGISYKHI